MVIYLGGSAAAACPRVRSEMRTGRRGTATQKQHNSWLMLHTVVRYRYSVVLWSRSRPELLFLVGARTMGKRGSSGYSSSPGKLEIFLNFFSLNIKQSCDKLIWK